jgi:hypothetical protein
MNAKISAVLAYLTVGAGLICAQGLAPLAASLTPLAANADGHAFEYVARADQSGDSAALYGYLTHIDGIDDATLFAVGAPPATSPRSEVNARLTVVGKLTFTNRFVNGNLVISSEDETMTIYFHEFPAARDFAKPDTFTQGAVVATFRNRVQTILNVQSPISAQSPGRGIVQATTDAAQESSTVFTLNGKRYAIGQVGGNYRLFSTGQGALASVSPLAASFVFGGFAEEASRKSPFRFFQ